MGNGNSIQLTSGDHTFGAYEAGPADGTRGLVVVQEIFGVNSHIRDVVDGYGAAGFHAVAPALFDRAEPGIELDYTQESIERGFKLARGGGIAQEDVVTDIVTAAQHLRAAGATKVGIVGYCWGGYLSTLASIDESDVFDAAVAYYGGGTPGLADSGRAPAIPLLMHFGETDHAIAVDDVRKLEHAWASTGLVEIHIYEGVGHGFNCDHRASYDAPAAALALERTLAFFAQHLG
jgi:carboxymethylenebutenolidase